MTAIKEKVVAESTQEIDSTPTEFPLSLEEFCTNLSKTDRRVELIGAFYRVNKNLSSALPSEFSTMFNAFVNTPA